MIQNTFRNQNLNKNQHLNQDPGGGGEWRRWLSVEQEEWRSLSVSAESLQKDRAAADDTQSDPEEHIGMVVDLTSVELISEQLRLQHQVISTC